ncbi:MAG: SRPBCC family protein [Proteobacteria bacterium]|nr:SRPBCC family protein [Pseudomonadota bacterium]
MATPCVKEKLDYSAERVWEIVGDFGNTSWFPGANAEIQGQGPGMVRLMGPPEGDRIREELISIDPGKRTLTYIIPENIPFPVTGYRATMTVTPGGADSCELEWSCECEPQGATEAEVVGQIEGMYQMMVGWLRDHLG